MNRNQNRLNELKLEYQQLKTEVESMERSIHQQERTLWKCNENLKDSEQKKREMKTKLENFLLSNQQQQPYEENDLKARRGMSPGKKGKVTRTKQISLQQEFKRKEDELQEKLRQEESSLAALEIELEEQKLQLKDKLAVRNIVSVIL